ncbi:MAG: class I SAM-dependent methyltransferase [Lactovum sp.]
MSKTNMYYEDNSDLSHKINEIKTILLGEKMIFETDSGVFSKNAIDYGTRVLIKNFKPQGFSLLDLGCGYGALSLVLVKKYGLKATLTDVNLRALDLAQKNARKNKVEVEILPSDIYDKITETFDSIISNPPIRAGKKVVHEIIEGALNYLNSAGQLWIVIQKKQGAASAQKKMQEVFGNVEVVVKDKGYYILRSVKNED